MRRVWLVPYARDWSYDVNARALARELANRFAIRVAYRGMRAADLRIWRPHLVVDFWWRGHAGKLLPGVPVIKQVSSHRWTQERYGALDAARLVERYLCGVTGTIVPSARLHAELARAGAPGLHRVRKGYDPSLFGDERRRGGELVIGWAGNSRYPDKRVELLQAAAPDLVLADHCYPHAEMSRWYNGVDVITCASDAEGDPLTLIEGMACGCFPVCTDVGIVPELVRHGENGLIVEQSAEAFAEAFAWCRANVDQVREAGRRNAVEMAATRTWSHVAGDWAEAFESALAGRA